MSTKHVTTNINRFEITSIKRSILKNNNYKCLYELHILVARPDTEPGC